MRLSALQKYTLTQCYQARQQKLSRRVIDRYYQKQAETDPTDDMQSIITRSVERLIDKELLIGYGRRTAQKWFIDEIKLTARGRRLAKTLLGQQQRLPLTTHTHGRSR